MAIQSVRIEANPEGIADLLVLPGVRALLFEKGEQVAAAAKGRGIRVEGVPGKVALPITVASGRDTKRARTLVYADHMAGMAVEAKHRLLVGSLDAARG